MKPMKEKAIKEQIKQKIQNYDEIQKKNRQIRKKYENMKI